MMNLAIAEWVISLLLTATILVCLSFEVNDGSA